MAENVFEARIERVRFQYEWRRASVFNNAVKLVGNYWVALIVFYLLALIASIATGTGGLAGQREEAFAPGKFIPTYAIKYGGTAGWPSPEEAARFDILVVSASLGTAKIFAGQEGTPWQHLKRINPNLKIFLYQNGPAMYDTSAWGQLGEGWEWLKREHGVNAPDRWLAVGARYGGPLQGLPYPNERLMNLGNPAWQEYWLEKTTAKFWAGERAPGLGADGIFADNCGYVMPWLGQWHLEGYPEKLDEPKDYVQQGTYQGDLFQSHVNAFYDRAIPWLKERGHLLVLNFGYMARHPEFWEELDSRVPTVFAAMEEGAFVHPWGKLGKEGNFVFYTEEQWLWLVQTFARLRHVKALMNVHGPVISAFDDRRRMDDRDRSGRRAWDVLWFAITSFLQGYDDQTRNGAMNFTVWGYSRFYWFDEFDPRYLHLGKAVGSMVRWEGQSGHVYAREFEDGWAVVNPLGQDVQRIGIPGGQARVINHDNLRNPESAPLVNRFNLPARTGCILLKPGREIGNSDNL